MRIHRSHKNMKFFIVFQIDRKRSQGIALPEYAYVRMFSLPTNPYYDPINDTHGTNCDKTGGLQKRNVTGVTT